MIAVRFTADHGRRKAGDVVRYDDASAAHMVDEARVAEYLTEPAAPPQERVEPTEPRGVEVEHTPTGADAPQTASAGDGD